MKGRNYPRNEKSKKTKIDTHTHDESEANNYLSDVKYRITYGKGFKATFEYLNGPQKGKAAHYDGRTRKWSGIDIPEDVRGSIEQFFHH